MCVVWAKDFNFYSSFMASSSKCLQVVKAGLFCGDADDILDSFGSESRAPTHHYEGWGTHRP